MSQDEFIKAIDLAKQWIKQEFLDDGIVFLKEKPKLTKPQPFVKLPIQVAPPVENVTQFKPISLDQCVSLGQLILAQVLVVVHSKEELERAMMEKMTAAIDTKIAKAMLIDANQIERNKLWKDLFTIAKKGKKILISEQELYQLPNLLEGYQKLPERKLFGIPLFLLADLKSYLQDIELKKSLWATLMKEI